MISAKIVADSICNGHRITTMEVVMPRIILAEFNTHRMLSKNSASSRAIPFYKMMEMVEKDPFIPIAWQTKHSGMQGTEYVTDPKEIYNCINEWRGAMDQAIAHAYNLSTKATKQLCNRLLEPFMWHKVLVTATEWENFFHLRCPQYTLTGVPAGVGKIFRSRKDLLSFLEKGEYQHSWEYAKSLDDTGWLKHNKGQAEIHMMALAEAMWDARNESKPKELLPGQWHAPYAPTLEELKENGFSAANPLEHFSIRIATARCAQTSYTTVGEDGKPTSYENLLDLHNSLLVRPYINRKGVVFGPDDPIHTSPSEHCAQAMTDEEYYGALKGTGILTTGDGESIEIETIFKPSSELFGWCHNLRGWKSYRSMIPNENRR